MLSMRKFHEKLVEKQLISIHYDTFRKYVKELLSVVEDEM